MKGIQFTVEAFRHYASDTAYQIQAGLASQGFTPYGRRFPREQDCTDMIEVLERERPDVVFCEGWNTWNPEMPQPPSKDVGFTGYEEVGKRDDILRVTEHSDPWKHPEMQQKWHDVWAPGAVLTRYDPALCMECAPWMDATRLVRMWHSITREYCRPVSASGRDRVCLLSGCNHERVYPLRNRIWREVQELPGWEHIFTIRMHHGWHRTGESVVPAYMEELARHKVAFVGTSRWYAAFKKHWEASAAGCIVVTNLPRNERPPVVEENLVRVPDDIPAAELSDLIQHLACHWDEERQADIARRVVDRYDYRTEAARIAGILEERWMQEVVA